MADLLTIWNMALGHIGEAVMVTDPVENTVQSQSCARFWEGDRDAVLAAHPWAFAERTLTAAGYEPAPHPWAFAYRLPPSAIAVRRVVPACGAHDAPSVPWARGGVTAADGVEIDLILTDQPLAWIAYTRRVEQVDRYPPAFVDALAWRLAWSICIPLSRSQETRQLCWQVYQQRLATAAVIDARQRREADPMARPL